MPPEIEDQNEQQSNEPMSLRDTLAASMEQHASSEDESSQSRARDEHGRFASKAGQETPPVAKPAPEVPTAQEAPQAAPTQAELTTWRREMRPLQAKLAAGEALSPEEARQLAEYNIQREREYSTGISTYKSEAQQSKAIRDVMQEFMPSLQQNGMAPEQWIQNMGRTHAALVYGSPEQKIQIFAQVAQGYGIPLDAIIQYAQGGGVAPHMSANMQQQSQLQQELQSVKQWMNQQEAQAAQQQLAKFRDATSFPHFEQVRDKMAQLLEAGLVNDPEEAYNAAVRLDPNLFSADQQRQAESAAEQQRVAAQAAAKKARAAGVSVRTGTPAAPAPRPATDLRGTLEDVFDQVSGAGRV